MLKHSSTPATERNRSLSRSFPDTLVYQFEGISLKGRSESMLKPPSHKLDKVLSKHESSTHKEFYRYCTGPPCSTNIFPFKYCLKTYWTFAEFNLAHPGGLISCNIVRKRIEQLGLFYLHAKVIWNSPTDPNRKFTDPICTVDDDNYYKIICFFQQTNLSTTKEYLAQQANMLIKRMKIMSHGELEGFSLYKSLCSLVENQYAIIIEFPLLTGATGERFIMDLIEFDQITMDICVSFGIFQAT